MHTMIALLPPPIEDTPEATLTRNHAAIARIAALASVNASEAELAAEAMLSTLPSPPKRLGVPNRETKSQLPKNETPKRQPDPKFHTVASINALIDAALRSADPNWKPSALPRSNNPIGRVPQKRTA